MKKNENVKGIFYERIGSDLVPIPLEIPKRLYESFREKEKFILSKNALFESVLKNIE